MKRGQADVFLEEEFSIGEYLSKILTDTSGECSRIRDSHIRLLAKHSEALTGEMVQNTDNIFMALTALTELSVECQRIHKELPELFLPILEYERKPTSTEAHRSFKLEAGRIKGAGSLVTTTRMLVYKERVDVVVNRERVSGVVLVTNDVVVVAVEAPADEDDSSDDAQVALRLYDALLIKELEISKEKGTLVLSLPPVTIVVAPSEHTSVDKVYKHIETIKQKHGPKIHSFELREADNRIEQEEYNSYLMRIGEISKIEKPSAEELVEDLKSLYLLDKGGKSAAKLIKLLKKEDIVAGFAAFCALVEKDLENKIFEIVHTKDNMLDIVERMEKLLKKQFSTIVTLFSKEPSIQGNVSLYLERIHMKAAETFLMHLFTASDHGSTDEAVERLKKAFVYDGYSFAYTLSAAEHVKKDLLKKRYNFNKKILGYVFEEVAAPTKD
ncbi:hypothetical protein NEDG_02151 [Nematocida displodere]|uniref:Uncharacterized protein n=1 Tax=Nematocida displodere TaxID=1805483 RepID=A0A177EFN5_9MICR|nr:hypothetical protein NEDG_02151 [Nematocida displodere]